MKKQIRATSTVIFQGVSEGGELISLDDYLSESIIVDPSFFVVKNGLKKLQAFEEEYARVAISRKHQAGIKVNQNTQSEQTTVNSDEPQSEQTTVNSDEPPYPTQEELERHKPKIILPSILKLLDRQGKPFNDRNILENSDLQEVLHKWGLPKKNFRGFVEEIINPTEKDKIQFFEEPERRKRIIYSDDPRVSFNPKKIGKNSLYLEQFVGKLSEPVSKVIFQMLAISQKFKKRILTCSRHFAKLCKKTTITTWKLVSAIGAASIFQGINCYFFSIGQDPAELLLELFPFLDLAFAGGFTFLLPLAPVAMAFVGTGKRQIPILRKWKEDRTDKAKEDGALTEVSYNEFFLPIESE